MVDVAIGERDRLDRAGADGIAFEGASSGALAICSRRSGEALSRTQLAPSALTASEDWVRAENPARRRVPRGNWRNCSSTAGNRRRRPNLKS